MSQRHRRGVAERQRAAAAAAAAEVSSAADVAPPPPPALSAHHVPRRLNARELAMNVGALYQTAGICAGSLLDVIIMNTIL